MAMTRLNLNLKEVAFPFLSAQQGGGSFFNDEGSYQHYPILSWINNLWPLTQGKWASVAATLQEHPPVPPEYLSAFQTTGVRVYTALVDNQRTYLLCGTAAWIVLSGGTWQLIYSPTTVSDPSVFSLKAQTYMYAPGGGLFGFDPVNPEDDIFSAITEQTLVGLDSTSLVSMCAGISYIIAADKDTIYWSAPLNNLYFSPGGSGANYGAGSTKALGIQSPITFLMGTEDGFYIFTEASVLKATYSGNPDNPWMIKGIDNSAGALNTSYLPVQETLNTTFYWSESGLAMLNEGTCTLIAPEITEVLAGDTYETYDPALHKVGLPQTGINIELQLSFLGNRFLCLSYGVAGTLRELLLCYDTVNRAWFRLSFPHLAITELVSVSSGAFTFDDWTKTADDTPESFESMLDTITNKQTNTLAVGVLGQDGNVYRISPIKIAVDNPGEFVLGSQIQFDDVRLTRNLMTELHEVTVSFSVPSFSGAGGANTEPLSSGTTVWAQSAASPIPRRYLEGYRDVREQKFVQRVTGQSITLTLENIGSITALNLGMRPAGRRLK